MRPVSPALLALSLLALPCAAQDAWTLDGKHVVVARVSGADEAVAKAAQKELAAWVGERAQAAKTPQVFVVSPESAATLVADLGKAGHALVEHQAKDLRAVSPQHAEVYDTYSDFLDLQSKTARDVPALLKIQNEMAKRLQSQEGLARPIRDVILVSKNKQERHFLARALGGFPPGPEQEAVLVLPEVSLVLTLARHLPEGDPKSLALLKRAYPRQAETNCKATLLREIAKAIGGEGDATFLHGVASDGKAARQLRAEAITALGRREDPQDFETLAALCKKGEEPLLRSRAILAAASSDGAKALPLLLGLREDPEMRLRASVVLGLGLIGSREAIQALEAIAKDDPEQAVRTRAQRLLGTLKRKQKKN